MVLANRREFFGVWWANFTTLTVSGFRLSRLHGGEWHAKSASIEPVDLEVVASATGGTVFQVFFGVEKHRRFSYTRQFVGDQSIQ